MAEATSQIRIKIGSEGDFAAFEKARQQAEMLKLGIEGVKSALELAGIGLSVGFFVEFAKGSAEAVIGMSHMAEQAQISASAFQTLNFVANDAGVRTEELSGFLNKLRNSMAQAQDGASKQNKAIHDLGLTTAELLAMPAEKQLEAISRGYETATDKGKAWAAVVELLGKNSAGLQEVLAKIGREGFSKLDEENAIWKVSDADIERLKKKEDALSRVWAITKNIAAAAVARPGDFALSVMGPFGSPQQFLAEGNEAKPKSPISLAPFEPITPGENPVRSAPDEEANKIREQMAATLAALPAMVSAHEALTKALKEEGSAYETLEQKAKRLREQAAADEAKAAEIKTDGNPADFDEQVRGVQLQVEASKLRAEANKAEVEAKKQAAEYASKEHEMALNLAAVDAKTLSFDQQRGQALAHLASIQKELAALDPKSLTYREDHLRLEGQELDIKRQIVELDVKSGNLLVDKIAKQDQSNQRLAAIALRSVEHDWNLTDNERWAEKNRLLDESIAKQRQIIADYNAISSNKALPESVRQKAGIGAETAGTTLAGLGEEKFALGPDPNDFSANWSKALADLRSEWAVTGASISKSFGGSVNSSLNSINSNLTATIMRTQTWQRAAWNVALTIENEVVGSFVKMATGWITNQILMATASKATQAASTAALVPIAAAQAAIWATPATLATIASFGGAAVAAPPEILAAMAATQGMALFERGGYTGDELGIVHPQEFVFSAPAVRNIGLDNLERAHQQALSSSTSFAASPAAPAPASSSSGGRPVTVVASFDKATVRKALQNSDGEAWVLDVFRKNRHVLAV